MGAFRLIVCPTNPKVKEFLTSRQRKTSQLNNKMSTTTTFQGMDTGAKPSSRVLAPPGGGGSNIFGHYQEEAPAQRRKETPKGTSDVFNQHAAQGPPAGQESRSQRSNQKIAYNPIAGEPIEPAKPKEVP